MTRGRKPVPCPDREALKRLADSGLTATEIGRHFGIGFKAVNRWLREIGMPTRRPQPQRPMAARLRFGIMQRSVISGRRLTSALYRNWTNMKGRCASDLPAYYKWYKAKGITVCDEWQAYAPFRAWAIANGFRKGLSLDRIDGNSGYSPSNCRWTTRLEQQNNTSAVHRLTLNGVTKTLPAWAREMEVSLDWLRGRVNRGWTDEEVLTVPSGGRRRNRVSQDGWF